MSERKTYLISMKILSSIYLWTHR